MFNASIDHHQDMLCLVQQYNLAKRLASAVIFKDVRPKVPTHRFFLIAAQKSNDLLFPKWFKKWGVTDFVWKENAPKKYPKSEKSGFVS